ncbi:MAG: hypothetical protein ACT4P7_18405 [Gemmatimonadaceae bacterium]
MTCNDFEPGWRTHILACGTYASNHVPEEAVPMLSNEKQALTVFRHVRDFLTESAPPVGFGSVAKLVEQLKAVIDKLEAYAREQDARSRQALAGTRTSQALSATIRREYLRPIASAAKVLFPADEPLLAALSMPQVRDYEGMMAAVEGMAQSASAHRQRFVEVGFPEDFVERMQKAAGDLRDAINARAVEFGRRAASTAGLRREYARGRDLVRVLNAMVDPRLAATPDRLAEWRTISRFERQNIPVEQPGTPAGDGDVPVNSGRNGSAMSEGDLQLV